MSGVGHFDITMSLKEFAELQLAATHSSEPPTYLSLNPTGPSFAKLNKPATIPSSNPQPAKKGTEVSDLKIYRFGTETDGAASMAEVLGGKGANLAEMSKLGVPVPPGYTIPCEASVKYTHAKFGASDSAFAQFLTTIESLIVNEGEAHLKKSMDGILPLVSVRSGARVSMPGMMDTILNVGLTDATLAFWTKRIGERATLDSYRRLMQMYGTTAAGINAQAFEALLKAVKQKAGVESDSALSIVGLIEVIEAFKGLYKSCGQEFPQNRKDQLMGAVLAVFRSWNNQRAIDYRKVNGIPDDWGTAVTVQAMVFGNMNDKSATGVLFTRNPMTGKNQITGEFLINAQGEDVVDSGKKGLSKPEPIQEMGGWNPALWEQLSTTARDLEKHYRDMQDIEFTIQDGKLYILQTRSGRKAQTARATFNIVHDLVSEGLITQKEAAQRVTADQLLTVMKPTINPSFKTEPNGTGIAAGGGIVSGVAVFKAEDAIASPAPCVLIREETDPDDYMGMAKSVGILTATGGLTSHAAVVARGMDKTCVVGLTDMKVSSSFANINGTMIHKGTKVTLDGTTGNVWVAVDVPVIEGGADEIVRDVVSWIGEIEAERLPVTRDNIIELLGACKSKMAYIDTCVLKLTTAQPLLDATQRIADGVKLFKGDLVVIDLRSERDYYSNTDRAVSRMFGKSKSTPGGNDPLHALMVSAFVDNTDWDSKAVEKVIFRLPDSSPFASAISKKGFKVLGAIKTVADFLAADEYSQVSEEILVHVFGGKEAYDKLVQLTGKKAGGKTLPPPRYWFEPIFKGE